MWKWPLYLALILTLNLGVFAARAEAQDCFWAPNNDGDPPRYATVAEHITDLEADFLSDPAYSDFIWTNSPAPSCREHRDEGKFGWQIQFDLIWSDETTDPGNVRHRTADIWAFDCDSGSPYFDGESCGPPPDCAATEGETIQRWVADTMDPSGVVNEGGCEYTASGVGACVQGTCFAEYTGTGELFEPPETAPENEPVDDPPCLEGQSGRTVCQDVQEQNCGYYMGEQYCVTPVDESTCKQTPSGAVICQADDMGGWPPEQPTTDFGGPKDPADEWEHTDSQGGGHDLGGWPDGSGGGTDPESGGSTDPGGEDGGGDDSEPCDPNVEDCGSGGHFEEPGEGEGFDDTGEERGEAEAELTSALQTVQQEIQQTFGDLAEGGGACPTWEFHVLNETYTLDVCGYTEVWNLIAAVILFIAAMVAISIIFRG